MTDDAARLRIFTAAAAAVGATLAGYDLAVNDVAALAATAARVSVAQITYARACGNAVANVTAGRIAYPFGLANSYGHPTDIAQLKYRSRGWTESFTTGSTDTDVAVGWESNVPRPLTATPVAGVCACGGVVSFTCA
jgi:hypothetical protein